MTERTNAKKNQYSHPRPSLLGLALTLLLGLVLAVPAAAQLALMADTDILVGMHGAGRVHTLWLPEWAVLYEIYNCGALYDSTQP